MDPHSHSVSICNDNPLSGTTTVKYIKAYTYTTLDIGSYCAHFLATFLRMSMYAVINKKLVVEDCEIA